MRCSSLIADAAHFYPGETSNRCSGLSEIYTVEINPEKNKKQKHKSVRDFPILVSLISGSAWTCKYFCLTGSANACEKAGVSLLLFTFLGIISEKSEQENGPKTWSVLGLTVVPVTAFLYTEAGIKKGLTITLTR